MLAKFTRKDFLEALFSDYYKEHRGFILVKSFRRGDPKTSTRYFPNIKILAKEHYGDDRDVYFGISPRERMKAEKEHVRYLVTLWADLDIGQEGHEDKKVFFEGPQQAAKAIRSFPRAPSIIVESGRGAHLYWLLRETEEIEDHEKAEDVLRNISQHLGCDTEVSLDTVLRLPETMNTEVPGKPMGCEVKFINLNARYGLEDFENLGARVVVPSGWSGAAAGAARRAAVGLMAAVSPSERPQPFQSAPGKPVDDSLLLDETIMDELIDDMSMTNGPSDSSLTQDVIADVTTRPDLREAPERTQTRPTLAPVEDPTSRPPRLVTSSVLERLSSTRATVEISLLSSNTVIHGVLVSSEDGLVGVRSGDHLYTIPISSISFIKSSGS